MNNVELYTTLPYASGVAMARGVLDSLMSATYFNASALRLIFRAYICMSFEALVDWSCRKKTLQRKFEVVCAEEAHFVDIFFCCIFRANNFEIYELKGQVSPGHNFSQFPGCCASWWRGAPPSSSRSPWRRGRGCGAGTAPPTRWWVDIRRLCCELKCSVQSPTQTERRDNFKDKLKWGLHLN